MDTPSGPAWARNPYKESAMEVGSLTQHAGPGQRACAGNWGLTPTAGRRGLEGAMMAREKGRRSGDVVRPQEGKGDDEHHGREHVDDGKNFDAAHAQARSHKDDSAAGREIAKGCGRHLRRGKVDGKVEEGEDKELRNGDQADGNTEKGTEDDPAKKIEYSLGEQDGRITRHRLVDGSENAHAAEAKSRNEGDNIDDVGLVSVMLALRHTEQGTDAARQKGFGEKQFSQAGAHDKRHDHHGKGGGFVDQNGAHTKGDDSEDEGKGFLDAGGDDGGTAGSDHAAEKKRATVYNRSNHGVSTVKVVRRAF